MIKNKKIIYIIVIVGSFISLFSFWRAEILNNYLPFFLTTDGWNKYERKINKPVVEITPSREAYNGCKWKKLTGAGLELWGQSCDFGDKKLEVNISETLPGVFLEDVTNRNPIAIQNLIQVFNIKNGSIDSIIPILADDESWNKTDGCAFQKQDIKRTDISRYILMPTGEALKKYEKQSKEEPINSTCGGYGMGNSGVQYFEIYNSNPNKVLFIQIGQEIPLFDENTIKVLPSNTMKDNKIMTELEAKSIAEKYCIKGGEALSDGLYNEITKTWWFDANLNSIHEGCNPACVVNEETKKAEINWRCTGLEKEVACTMDAKECPDGSYVGRTGPKCEFICP